MNESITKSENPDSGQRCPAGRASRQLKSKKVSNVKGRSHAAPPVIAQESRKEGSQESIPDEKSNGCPFYNHSLFRKTLVIPGFDDHRIVL
jgi:hypothetical protein